MHAVFLSILAATYGTNTYDTSVYGGASAQASTGAAGGGGLTNTGIAIASFVTVACLVLLVAVLVRFWRRPAKPADTTPEA